MSKTVIFQCKIEGLNFESPEELMAILEKVGLAIQELHPSALIDPAVQVMELASTAQSTSLGDAVIDAYLEVKRSNGELEYIHVVDGQNHSITQEQYKAAHAVH